jgi:ABC-type sulfate transport system permease subunit
LVLARTDNRPVRTARPIILLGKHLEAAGIQIAFTTTAVVLAQNLVSLPFLVIALEGAARTVGARASHAHCRLRSTCNGRATPTLRSRCRSCSSQWAAVVGVGLGSRRLRAGGADAW